MDSDSTNLGQDDKQLNQNSVQDSVSGQDSTSPDTNQSLASQGDQGQSGGVQESDDGKMRTKTSDKAKYIVKVDVEACIGAASCVAIASKVFELDDQQKAVILDPAGDTPENILMAAQSCPTKAVILVDRETGKQVWPEA